MDGFTRIKLRILLTFFILIIMAPTLSLDPDSHAPSVWKDYLHQALGPDSHAPSVWKDYLHQALGPDSHAPSVWKDYLHQLLDSGSRAPSVWKDYLHQALDSGSRAPSVWKDYLHQLLDSGSRAPSVWKDYLHQLLDSGSRAQSVWKDYLHQAVYLGSRAQSVWKDYLHQAVDPQHKRVLLKSNNNDEEQQEHTKCDTVINKSIFKPLSVPIYNIHTQTSKWLSHLCLAVIEKEHNALLSPSWIHRNATCVHKSCEAFEVYYLALLCACLMVICLLEKVQSQDNPPLNRIYISARMNDASRCLSSMLNIRAEKIITAVFSNHNTSTNYSWIFKFHPKIVPKVVTIYPAFDSRYMDRLASYSRFLRKEKASSISVVNLATAGFKLTGKDLVTCQECDQTVSISSFKSSPAARIFHVQGCSYSQAEDCSRHQKDDPSTSSDMPTLDSDTPGEPAGVLQEVLFESRVHTLPCDIQSDCALIEPLRFPSGRNSLSQNGKSVSSEKLSGKGDDDLQILSEKFGGNADNEHLSKSLNASINDGHNFTTQPEASRRGTVLVVVTEYNDLSAVSVDQQGDRSTVSADQQVDKSAVPANQPRVQSAVPANQPRVQSAVPANQRRDQSAVPANQQGEQSAVPANQQIVRLTVQEDRQKNQPPVDHSRELEALHSQRARRQSESSSSSGYSSADADASLALPSQRARGQSESSSSSGYSSADADASLDDCNHCQYESEFSSQDVKYSKEPCAKNPGHFSYFPLWNLKLDYIPLNVRHPDVLKFFQNISALTVRIVVAKTSTRRPKSNIVDTAAEYKMGTGIAVVEPAACYPIPNVDHPEHPGKWSLVRKYLHLTKHKGFIFIETNSHLVQDDEEAQSTTVEFFYDHPNRKQLVCVKGVSVHHSSVLGDSKSILICRTSDLALINMVKEKQREIETLAKNFPRNIKEGMSRRVYMVSHPHGEEKVFCYGDYVMVKYAVELKTVNDQATVTMVKINNFTKISQRPGDIRKLLLYTADTCNGCTGAPVVTFRKTGSGNTEDFVLDMWMHGGIDGKHGLSVSLTKALISDDIVNHGLPTTSRPSIQDEMSTEADRAANQVVSSPTFTVFQPPSHPAYAAFRKRLESYPDPFIHVHTAMDLADCGFFFAGYSDCVRCFQCGLGLRSWRPGDIIHEEHIKNRPDCQFLLMKLREAGIDVLGFQSRVRSNSEQNTAEFMRSPSSANETHSNLQRGNEVTKLTMIVQQPAVSARPPFSEDNTTQMKLRELNSRHVPRRYPQEIRVGLVLQHTIQTDTQSPIIPSPGRGTQQRGNEAAQLTIASHQPTTAQQNAFSENNTAQTNTHDLSSPNDSLQERTSGVTRQQSFNTGGPNNPRDSAVAILQREQMYLNQVLTCKVCLGNPVKELFLPCGELVACTECSKLLSHCPSCSKLILATVTTYFS